MGKKKVKDDEGIFSFAMPNMFGRTVIYSSITEVNEKTIPTILGKIRATHSKNSKECDYLWNYRKGKQPILARKKKVRPDILNKIIVNRADEIVNFKVGYYVGKPIQYTSNIDTQAYLDDMETLNKYMYAISKASLDQELVEWMMVCGTAYRLVLPTPKNAPYREYKPFELHTLDPRCTFVVYSTEVGHKTLLSGTYYEDDNGVKHYTCYTDKMCYKFQSEQFVSKEPHALGENPIIEYPANEPRLGCFEPALPLLDAINLAQSNRLDGVEQTVQSYIKFINCIIDEEKYENFLEKGAIMVGSTDGNKADVDTVTVSLDQNQVQTLIDDLYDSVLEICGVPSRSANASGDSTGSAIILRNGWQTAEARAKVFGNCFKESEAKMLSLVLTICSGMNSNNMKNLKPWDIETHFTSENYDNIVSKAQVLVTMLDNPKIHPILAFEKCGMFTDPEGAWIKSEAYYKEKEAEYEPITVNEIEDSNNEGFVRTNRQVVGDTEETDKTGVSTSN